MQQHFRQLLVFFSLWLWSGIFLQSVQAQTIGKNALSLDVSPPVSYLYVKPGAGISAPVTIQNNGRYTLRVTPQLVDFHADNQTGRVVLEQKSDFKQLSIAGDLEKWGETFTVKPGEKVTVPLVIAVPANFAQGEYHLSVLFQADQMLFADQEQNNNSKLSGIVASHLVLMVSLDEADRSQIVIKEFKLPKLVDSLMGIRWQIIAKNIGLNAGPVTGQLKISHWPSPEVTVYELYPDMVLANSQRQARGVLSSDLAKLETLNQQEAVMTANGEDFLAKKAELSQAVLKKDFYYKKTFLLGAYDFHLSVGDEEITKRVIALPFSVLILFIVLPLLYRLFIILLKIFEPKKATSKKKNDLPE